jgi:hypothetical protein
MTSRQETIIRHIGDQQGEIINEFGIADLMKEAPDVIMNELRALGKQGLVDISAETHNDGCPTFLTSAGEKLYRSLKPIQHKAR